jgi:Ca2+-binding RTX toxin-like protein
VVDAGDGNDFVSEFGVFGGGTPAAPGTKLMLDGGPGFDILSADVSRETQPLVWDSASPTNIEFSSGSYLRNFEVIRDVIGTSGNDVVIQLGRVNNNIDTGAGDDVINPGLGIDQVNPGPGNNLLILDFSAGDDANFGGLTYSASTTIERHDLTSGALVDQVHVFAGSTDRYDLTGTSKADVLRGGSEADILRGGAGDDSLDGGAGNDVLNGAFGPGVAGSNEIDRLHGATGADIFVLGSASGRFYDDQSPATPGTQSYAIIDDFTPSQGDRLRIFGAAGEYLLGNSPIPSTPGAALYHDSNANGSLDAASDELIAILVSPVTLTPSNTIATAAFVQAVSPASAGLTVIGPTIRNAGSDGRFALEFSIVEPMPEGLLIEIQVSTNLGAGDPWRTIAAKSGIDPWRGPAMPSVSAPSGGRVVVIVPTVQPVRNVRSQFLRFRLSNY